VVEVDEPQMVKTIENGVVVERPFSEVKKKVPSDIGGKAATSGLNLSKLGAALGGKAGGLETPSIKKQKTPEERLKSIGLNVTFQKPEPKNKLQPVQYNPELGVTENLLGISNEPEYVDLSDEDAVSNLTERVNKECGDRC
jgi:hypothetical protein